MELAARLLGARLVKVKRVEAAGASDGAADRVRQGARAGPCDASPARTRLRTALDDDRPEADLEHLDDKSNVWHV